MFSTINVTFIYNLLEVKSFKFHLKNGKSYYHRAEHHSIYHRQRQFLLGQNFFLNRLFSGSIDYKLSGLDFVFFSTALHIVVQSRLNFGQGSFLLVSLGNIAKLLQKLC